MACHRRIEQRLETLIRAGDHLQRDRAAALEAIRKSVEFLDSSGARHTEDEERSVFPRLRRKLGAEQLAYLDSLEQQHTVAEELFSRLKELVRQAGQQDPVLATLADRYGACARELESLYRRHICSEDQILTALARQSLSNAELAEISREMRERRAG